MQSTDDNKQLNIQNPCIITTYKQEVKLSKKIASNLAIITLLSCSRLWILSKITFAIFLQTYFNTAMKIDLLQKKNSRMK